jgi:hypothetical protein
MKKTKLELRFNGPYRPINHKSSDQFQIYASNNDTYRVNHLKRHKQPPQKGNYRK